MQKVAYHLGYASGWIWNREGMPLDMAIGDQLVIGGVTIAVLVGLSLL